MGRLNLLIQKLHRTGQHVLREKVAQHLGVSLPTLRKYPEVEAFLRTVKTRHRTNRTALYEQVEAADESWRQRGEPTPQRPVAGLMGTSWRRLGQYAELGDFLGSGSDVSAHQDEAKQQREA